MTKTPSEETFNLWTRAHAAHEELEEAKRRLRHAPDKTRQFWGHIVAERLRRKRELDALILAEKMVAAQKMKKKAIEDE